MKVVFCTLFLGDKPHPKFTESLAATVPVIEALGWEHEIAIERNNPYISAARAKVLRLALDAKADVLVYLDYDVSWRPEDMVKLLTTEGDVVAGTYRKKRHDVEYMSNLSVGPNGIITRSDGCIKASKVPAGFLKLTVDAVNFFAKAYPQLMFGPPMTPNLDMFNHGAIDGIWYGEDYAFSKRWIEAGGELWIIPDMNIDHWRGDTCYPGNLHQYLLKWNGPKPIESEPLVSVVIPSYNYEQYIGETIESVLNQTYKNIELVVVDDGSPDNSNDVISRYPVKLIHQENKGLPGACNTGAKNAAGEYILFLGADDVLDPEFIEKCLQYPHADIITTGLQEFGTSDRILMPKSERIVYEDFVKENCINASSLIRRSAWDEHGWYDESMVKGLEDWELWIRMAKAGCEIQPIFEPLFKYRKHGASLMDSVRANAEELVTYVRNKHSM